MSLLIKIESPTIEKTYCSQIIGGPPQTLGRVGLTFRNFPKKGGGFRKKRNW